MQYEVEMKFPVADMAALEGRLNGLAGVISAPQSEVDVSFAHPARDFGKTDEALRLRRKGDLNEREARSHPRRNALQQSLGAGNQFIEPHIGAVGCQSGDRVLICSDGLVDGLWDRRIEEIVRAHSPAPGGPTVAQELVDESVRESGRDNTTALVIRVS